MVDPLPSPQPHGSPHHFQDYSEEWDNKSAENLGLCFTHWRALQTQPQLTNFVKEFCNAILQNVPRAEGGDSVGMYKRFLFHYSKTQTPHLKNSNQQSAQTGFNKKPRNGRNLDVYSK
uniref:neuromedin-S-like isoform X2 n=1 Tax=Pristiophorus japonicus TaxID=55135 RepID=UPI00398F295A